MNFRRLSMLLISFMVLTIVGSVANAQKSQLLGTQYIFPLNASKSLPRSTNIIIRPGPILNPATVKASLLTVTGSFSGKHSGTFVLSTDKKTLVFTSKILFTYSERVTVKLSSGIRAASGALVDQVSFYFTIQSQPKSGVTALLTIGGNGGEPVSSPESPESPSISTSSDSGSVPANSPGLTNDVLQLSSQIVSGVSLSTPYPNPCSGFSSLAIELPVRMTIYLGVFDGLGHEVSRIAEGMFEAGPHTFGFDAKGLLNGIYHCILRTDGSVIVHEIVLAK